MALALPLSVLIGLSLGLLGAGGSILTLPILVYALHVEPKSAIAMSLLVVALTSAAALIPHARAGRVRWRTALVFGVAGMAGAFPAGLVAQHVPAGLLLGGFAVLMVAAAVAMLRRGPAIAPDRPRSVPRIVADGVVVGAITGLVGAGGGFLVVPALVLFGGLPMEAAIGTSLVVISMKSFAAFAGYLGHVEIDWALAALVAGAAVAGSVVGGRLSGRVPAAALRHAFGWMTLLMALFILGRQLPMDLRETPIFQAVFVDRWPWFVGGGAIAAVVLSMLWYDNKLLGVSTGCAELGRMHCDPALRKSWRPKFLLGIVFGGLAATLIGGGAPTFAMGTFDQIVGAAPVVKVPVLLGAGLLIGYGARWAGGCTSGHGIVGVAQGARSSLIATAMFMLAGFGVTWLVAPHG